MKNSWKQFYEMTEREKRAICAECFIMASGIPIPQHRVVFLEENPYKIFFRVGMLFFIIESDDIGKKRYLSDVNGHYISRI